MHDKTVYCYSIKISYEIHVHVPMLITCRLLLSTLIQYT